jgi:hypothetical protein
MGNKMENITVVWCGFFVLLLSQLRFKSNAYTVQKIHLPKQFQNKNNKPAFLPVG